MSHKYKTENQNNTLEESVTITWDPSWQNESEATKHKWRYGPCYSEKGEIIKNDFLENILNLQ